MPLAACTGMVPKTADAHSLLLRQHRRRHLRHRPDGRCTFVNPAALRLLGHRTESVLGRNMHELVHHTPCGRAALPRVRLPDLQGLPRGRGLPHRRRGAVARRRHGLPVPSTPATRCWTRGARWARWSASSTSASASGPKCCCARPTTSWRRAWASARASSATRWRGCASVPTMPRRCASRSARASRARSTTSWARSWWH